MVVFGFCFGVFVSFIGGLNWVRWFVDCYVVFVLFFVFVFIFCGMLLSYWINYFEGIYMVYWFIIEMNVVIILVCIFMFKLLMSRVCLWVLGLVVVLDGMFYDFYVVLWEGEFGGWFF